MVKSDIICSINVIYDKIYIICKSYLCVNGINGNFEVNAIFFHGNKAHTQIHHIDVVFLYYIFIIYPYSSSGHMCRYNSLPDASAPPALCSVYYTSQDHLCRYDPQSDASEPPGLRSVYYTSPDHLCRYDIQPDASAPPSLCSVYYTSPDHLCRYDPQPDASAAPPASAPTF